MPGQKAKWTILTYIAAHNNLENFGMRSWRQICDVGSTKQVIHGVLFDGPNGASRYIFGDPGKQLLKEDFDKYDSGDPKRLVETATWLFQQYPAENYGLVLWSHGTGWQPNEIQQVAEKVRGDIQVDSTESSERAISSGSLVMFRTSLAELLKENKPAERAILFDDGSGHSIDTLELLKVTSQIHAAIGQPLDLLGMDACLMANLEVAYQIRKSVGCLVASEELVPGHSWPYDVIYGQLKSNPDLTAEQLAVLIVDRYTEYYKAHPPGAGDVTKVALKLAGIERLAQDVDTLAVTILEEMDQTADLLWEAQRLAKKQEAKQDSRGKDTRVPNKFYYHLWDLRSLAAHFIEEGQASSKVKVAAQTVIDALEPGGPCVLAEGHLGEWFKGIGGVTVYLMPPSLQRISPYYSQIALTKDIHWYEMLQAYHAYY